MKRRGFTWIECVLVLVILAILAAILLPVFSRSREDNPGRARCQFNIRQIGLGIKQYLSDYDERYPIVNTGGGTYGWADGVQPYVRNTQLFQCPTDHTQPPTGSATTVVGTDLAYTDYFYNRLLQAKSVEKLHNLNRTIMLGDALTSNARSWSNGCRNLPCATSEAGQPALLPGAAMRHLGGANYSFADGHVKWIKAESNTQSSRIMSGNTNADPSTDNYTFSIR